MEFLRKNGVRGKCCWIELWMIDQHLLDIGPRTLRVGNREVCAKIIERRPDSVNLVSRTRVAD